MTAIKVGQAVVAARRVTEGGTPYRGDEDSTFPSPDYIHAETGERGVVEYVDDEGDPTVRFDRTGTATVVSFGEEVIPV